MTPEPASVSHLPTGPAASAGAAHTAAPATAAGDAGRARGSSWFDAEDAPSRRDLNTCIHCGLCLTACPTYRELKIEPDSPRGRIYLMRGLAEGRIGADDALIAHLDNCLDCRACETVCPAGVPYSRMLEETRGQLARRAVRRGLGRRLGEWALSNLIPDRGRMNFAADLMRFGQSAPIASFMRSRFAWRALPSFAFQGYAMTPPIESRRERSLERLADLLPAGARMSRDPDGSLVFHPAGEPKRRVAFFVSCVMAVMFPRVTREAIRMLVLCGARVDVPCSQGCCGALHAHAGLRREAKTLARRNVRAFDFASDFIVTHSAGCGAALRETGHLLAEDHGAGAPTDVAHGGPPEIVARASASATTATEKFSARVRDVSEVLAELGLPSAPAPLCSPHDGSKPLRIAYHDPCHLAHAQKVRSAPRTLLRSLPGVELVDLPNADWCCGSAGVYNLTHPEMADAQLDQKLDSIVAVAPDVVVASNPGCLLHMARGAKQRGMDVPMLHLAEVLGRAYPVAERSAGARTSARPATPSGRKG
ncbi:MAG: (Fe-S)-binding protein [Candidatus Eisenbacteria bacterium]|nr:(Fe-S)-binding protein [Candidatus Eisenbacteria bacterium]